MVLLFPVFPLAFLLSGLHRSDDRAPLYQFDFCPAGNWFQLYRWGAEPKPRYRYVSFTRRGQSARCTWTGSEGVSLWSATPLEPDRRPRLPMIVGWSNRQTDSSCAKRFDTTAHQCRELASLARTVGLTPPIGNAAIWG
jgi:hypothetical protein